MIVASPPMRNIFDHARPVTSFHLRWLLALFVTLAINGLLIYREARRRGDPLISPGMRAAFRALIPPMLSGGVFFCLFGSESVPALLAIFYGLALLATAHFAPRSILWLGWSFLVAGLAIFIVRGLDPSYLALSPDWIMVATFGGFHFIYAACTWPRRATAAALGATP